MATGMLRQSHGETENQKGTGARHLGRNEVEYICELQNIFTCFFVSLITSRLSDQLHLILIMHI